MVAPMPHRIHFYHHTFLQPVLGCKNDSMQLFVWFSSVTFASKKYYLPGPEVP